MKKQIFMGLLLLVGIGLNAQKPVTITGNVSCIPDGAMVRVYEYAVYSHITKTKRVALDSCTVKGGAFELKLNVTEPQQVILECHAPFPSNRHIIVAPGEHVTVTGSDQKGLYTTKATGDVYEDKYFETQEKAWRGNIPDGMNQTQYMEQIVKENANTFFGPLLVYAYSGYKLDFAKMYALFTPEVQQSFHGKALKAYVDVLNAEKQSRNSADFKAKLAKVKRVTPAYKDVNNVVETIAAQYPGKVVFVDFWATWCGPCRKGMQTLKAIEPWMAENGIVRVYLSAPSSEEGKWETMATEIGGEHYFMTEDEWKAIFTKFGIEGIPTYQIFDKNGKRYYQNTGFPGNEVLMQEFKKAL